MNVVKGSILPGKNRTLNPSIAEPNNRIGHRKVSRLMNRSSYIPSRNLLENENYGGSELGPHSSRLGLVTAVAGFKFNDFFKFRRHRWSNAAMLVYPIGHRDCRAEMLSLEQKFVPA